MNLTKAERTILSIQYRILAKLFPEGKGEFERATEIVENGYEGEYDSICAHISDDFLTSEECKEVIDILEMYDAIQCSSERLGDKSGLECRLKFIGFDGNYETKQMEYAKYCFERPRYDRFKKLFRSRELDSHWPTLARYKAMLREWEKLGRKTDLAKEEIVRIIRAN